MPDRLRRAAAAAVYLHAVIVMAHGAAHSRLRIELTAWGSLFVATVIGLAPIVAVVLLHSGKRFGASILGAAMTGALLFGVWNHFVLEGADHVGHLPHSSWALAFQVTAWLLAATELTGSVLAFQLLRSATSSYRSLASR